MQLKKSLTLHRGRDEKSEKAAQAGKKAEYSQPIALQA